MTALAFNQGNKLRKSRQPLLKKHKSKKPCDIAIAGFLKLAEA